MPFLALNQQTAEGKQSDVGINNNLFWREHFQKFMNAVCMQGCFGVFCFACAFALLFFLELSVSVSSDSRQYQPPSDLQLDIQFVSMERQISIVGEFTGFPILWQFSEKLIQLSRQFCPNCVLVKYPCSAVYINPVKWLPFLLLVNIRMINIFCFYVGSVCYENYA